MRAKKTWLYCRVAHSGSDSVEILAAQQRRLEAYAKAHDLSMTTYSFSPIGSPPYTAGG
jgi:hypothetical protein